RADGARRGRVRAAPAGGVPDHRRALRESFLRGCRSHSPDAHGSGPPGQRAARYPGSGSREGGTMKTGIPGGGKPDRDLEHRGPPPGMLAIVFTVLFNAGLSFVISFSPGRPHFPGPWESAETIAAYFRDHPRAVLMCAFLQFGSAIPLGLFTAA